MFTFLRSSELKSLEIENWTNEKRAHYEVFFLVGIKQMVIDSNVENTERQIQHFCTPFLIVSKKPNVKNYKEAL